MQGVHALEPLLLEDPAAHAVQMLEGLDVIVPVFTLIYNNSH